MSQTVHLCLELEHELVVLSDVIDVVIYIELVAEAVHTEELLVLLQRHFHVGAARLQGFVLFGKLLNVAVQDLHLLLKSHGVLGLFIDASRSAL